MRVEGLLAVGRHRDGRRRVFIPLHFAPHPACVPARPPARLYLYGCCCFPLLRGLSYCSVFVLAPKADIPPTIAAATTTSSTTTPGERNSQARGSPRILCD